MIQYAAALALTSIVGFGQSDTSFLFQAREAVIPPVIDGVVDDSVWAVSDVAADFIQFEPHRGTSSAYRSEARLLFDETTLYIAFVMWDPEPVTALPDRWSCRHTSPAMSGKFIDCQPRQTGEKRADLTSRSLIL